jgi:hypothetical protein
MSERKIIFRLSNSDDEIEKLYNYNVNVFAEAPDMQWSVDALKDKSRDGWKIYSVLINEEIIAAALLKKENDKLLTKNTPIKLLYQGNGFSHLIKDFFEDEARKLSVETVINLCPSDNFRMISLNETHGYSKTGQFFGEKKSLIEWIKEIK